MAAGVITLNGVITTEPCPECGDEEATCQHGCDEIGPKHLWKCPTCGECLSIVGYDCPNCPEFCVHGVNVTQGTCKDCEDARALHTEAAITFHGFDECDPGWAQADEDRERRRGL